MEAMTQDRWNMLLAMQLSRITTATALAGFAMGALLNCSLSKSEADEYRINRNENGQRAEAETEELTDWIKANPYPSR